MNALNRRRNRSRQGGFAAFLIIIIIVAMVTVLSSSMLVTNSVFNTSQAIDRIRQISIERRSIEEIVKQSIMARFGTAGGNASRTVDQLIDNSLAAMDMNARSVSITRATASAAVPLNRMFPDSSRATVGTPNFATTPVNFQAARFLRGGAVELTGSMPLEWVFNRTGTVADENTTIRVTARLWSVPMSNFSLIGYGLPASVANGAGIPRVAPANADTVLNSVAFRGGGGQSLLVTTLRPFPDFSDGDPTAFNTLYIPPSSPTANERLPRFYITPASLAWDAWEYIFSNTYSMLLLSSAGANAYYFGSATPPTIPGLTVNSATTITVNLQNVTGSSLAIIDLAGGSTINLVGATSGTPLVVSVRNASGNRSNINLSGINRRTTLIYANNHSVNFTGNASFNGGLFLDRLSTMTGVGSVQGMIAFYAAGGYPSTATVTLTPSTGAIKTDLDSITPRALLVTTN